MLVVAFTIALSFTPTMRLMRTTPVAMHHAGPVHSGELDCTIEPCTSFLKWTRAESI